MGEIADMMLDGTMCSGCGEWMDDGNDGPGFPGLCAGCAREAPRPLISNKKRGDKKLQCEHGCKKWFSTEAARTQHTHDKHGSKP